MCAMHGRGIPTCSKYLSLLTTKRSREIWVTMIVQQYTDIADLKRWWDLRGTIPIWRLGR